MKNNWTGERLETFIKSRDAIEHLHRYSLALEYIKEKVVVDIASGEGYGSNLMSKVANHVYGVDIDKVAIENAKIKYIKNNLEFLNGSADNIPIASNSVDVVVSFETIEHHNKHDEMMSEIKRILKEDGLLIMSSPDKQFYSDARNYKNEFHVKELYKDEFIALISKYFKNHQFLSQVYVNDFSIITDDQSHVLDAVYDGDYSEIEKYSVNALFLITIAGNCTFKKSNLTVFNGVKLKNEEHNSLVYLSNSYRLGSFLLSPLKMIKKIIKTKNNENR